MTGPHHIPLQAMPPEAELRRLRSELDGWMRAAGFAEARVTDTDLSARRADLEAWLAEGRHGEMAWMRNHLDLRLAPELLEPGTTRVISARMDYRPAGADPQAELARGENAYISLYARGRDYHKLMRRRLARVADHLRNWCQTHRYRALVDSAPALEKPLAEKAGLGWLGKHTLLLDREAGSWFFLGEIFTSLPLPVDTPSERGYCGSCQACIDACPTGAITGPWQIDARRCISYLTIEHPGSIPESLRPLVGNRVFGCDDCQMVCPWNREGTTATEPAFAPRETWRDAALTDLMGWSEDRWKKETEGSALRRTGYLRWLRNLAVALGNAPGEPAALAALRQCAQHTDDMVREHVQWAIGRQEDKLGLR